jgi:endonuclease YncB( thermonuclease family)
MQRLLETLESLAGMLLTAAVVALIGVTMGIMVGENSSTAQVTRIIDGDTIEVMYQGEQRTVRFARLDAPESDEPGGSAATQALRERLAGESVEIQWGDDEGRTHGFYGRWLGRIEHEGQDVGDWMVEQGHGELVY